MSNWTQQDIDRLQQKGLKVNLPLKNSTANQPASFALGRMKAGSMNKTELLYAKHLEVQKQFGNVAWYEFEPMNLRLGEKCFYSVDFMVMLKSGELECHEVKGGFITDDSLVKFKVAAAKFPFKFRMVMLKKGEWIEKYLI
jgi:hypothetical protein